MGKGKGFVFIVGENLREWDYFPERFYKVPLRPDDQRELDNHLALIEASPLGKITADTTRRWSDAVSHTACPFAVKRREAAYFSIFLDLVASSEIMNRIACFQVGRLRRKSDDSPVIPV